MSCSTETAETISQIDSTAYCFGKIKAMFQAYSLFKNIHKEVLNQFNNGRYDEYPKDQLRFSDMKSSYSSDDCGLIYVPLYNIISIKYVYEETMSSK